MTSYLNAQAARSSRVVLFVLCVALAPGCDQEAEVKDPATVPPAPNAVPDIQPSDPAAESDPNGANASGQDASAIPLEEVIETIAWQDAVAYEDQEVLVVGRIVDTGRGAGHAFLNFGPRDNDSLVLFIDKKLVPEFPASPTSMFRNKVVRAHGFVSRYKGQLELAIKAPGDIVILPDETALPEVKTASATAPAAGPPQPWTLPEDGAITLATYNILNLFDRFDDPYHADSSVDEKPREQMEKLAASIRALDADVLAVEEVENRGVLERFVRAFLADMGYEVVLYEGNDRRGIDVAVLTRIPVGPVTSYRHIDFTDSNGEPMRFRRDLLQVRLEPPGGVGFDVFVVHFKSKRGEDEGGNGEIRLNEARQVRRLFDGMLARDPQARFVICGDFNDTYESEPVRAVLGEGPAALRSFVDDLPSESRITFNEEPYRSMIDYVFASPAMAERYVRGSYTIGHDGSPDETGSDHNPVVVRFTIR